MDHIDKDEELVCPLCGGQVLWMPVSHIYVCEHCKQSYSEGNVVYLQKKRKATAEKSSAVGDAAKLREALLRCDAIAQLPEVRNEQSIKDMRNIIKRALSAPPRQCDIGTAEEQEDRFNKYCRGSNYCAVCPIRKLWDFRDGHSPSCTILWSQMPYEAQEGGADV